MEVHFTPEQEEKQVPTQATGAELPVWQLGAESTLRRRDLYDDTL